VAKPMKKVGRLSGLKAASYSLAIISFMLRGSQKPFLGPASTRISFWGMFLHDREPPLSLG